MDLNLMVIAAFVTLLAAVVIVGATPSPVIVAENYGGSCLGAYQSLTEAQQSQPGAALYRPVFAERNPW